MLLDGEEERWHHDNICHSIYNPATLLNLCMTCLIADTNHKLAIKICNTLKDQIKRLQGTQEEAPSTEDDQISQLIHLLLSFAYIRLHATLPTPTSSQEMQDDQGLNRHPNKDEDCSSISSFEKQIENPSFLLQQSLTHFKNYNADISLPGQSHVIVWMYMYTQKQLISKHQMLQKRFRKQVILLDQSETDIAPSIKIEQS